MSVQEIGRLVLLLCLFVVYCVGHSDEIRGNGGGYVCAGNGYYIAGQQNGSFPAHGWHIPGEMAGVWMQPIKLLHSYDIAYHTDHGQVIRWTGANTFLQFPWGNQFEFSHTNYDLIKRENIVDNYGIIIEAEVEGAQQDVTGSFTWNLYPSLRGAWLSELLGKHDDDDICTWDEHNNSMLCQDSSNRYMAVSLDTSFIPNTKASNLISLQSAGILKSSKLFITGSTISVEDCITKLKELRSNKRLWTLKRERYLQVSEKASVTLPDKELQEAYTWSKYNIHWLFNTIPSLGSGVFGGLPEYPMFFGCDTTYAVEGMLAIGMYREAMQSLDLLAKASLAYNGNGRILHEMTADGVVFNPGNMQETSHYIMQVAAVYQYTSNATWLVSHYESVWRGLQYLMERDTDGNGIPEGSGIMEIGGFYLPSIEMIDVAVYTLQAYKATAYIFEELIFLISTENNSQQQTNYLDRIDCNQHSEHECEQVKCMWGPISSSEYEMYQLPGNTPWCYFPHWNLNMLDVSQLSKNKITIVANVKRVERFLSELAWLDTQNSYAEFFATPVEAIPIIEEAIERIRIMPNRRQMEKNLKELLSKTKQLRNTSHFHEKRGWNVYQSWITAIPLEQGLASHEKAIAALKTAEMFANEYGMYVTGVDKPDSSDSSSLSYGLYTNAVMTLPTGVQSVSESQYLNVQRVLSYLKKLSKSFSYETPGSLHELSPSGGCYVQAWNIYSVSVPIIRGIFGIHISTSKSQPILTISPLFPPEWDSMDISDVAFHVNSSLSYFCRMNPSVIRCELFNRSTVENLSVEFNWILEQPLLRSKPFTIYLNDKPIRNDNNNAKSISIPLQTFTNISSWTVKWERTRTKQEL